MYPWRQNLPNFKQFAAIGIVAKDKIVSARPADETRGDKLFCGRREVENICYGENRSRDPLVLPRTFGGKGNVALAREARAIENVGIARAEREARCGDVIWDFDVHRAQRVVLEVVASEGELLEKAGECADCREAPAR